jgi:hypothetical protein
MASSTTVITSGLSAGHREIATAQQSNARTDCGLHAGDGAEWFSPAVRNGKVHKLEVKTMTKGQSVRTQKTYVAVAPGG